MLRLRYDNLGSALSVDITPVCTPEFNKDKDRRYVIECFYYYCKDDNDSVYQIGGMWLLRKDVELKIRIDEDAVIIKDADKSNIRTKVRDYIVRLAEEGRFNAGIEQMDYIVDCFDIGDDVLWKEEQRRITEENDLS